MKTMFANPEIEVLKFSVADVINASGASVDPDDNAGEEDTFGG